MFNIVLNKCASLHRGEPPLWLATGRSNRECLRCLISIIADTFGVISVRQSAVYRLRAAVEHPNSRACFPQLPLDTLATKLVHTVSVCEQDESMFLEVLLDTVVSFAFAVDATGSQGEQLKLTGKLLLLSAHNLSSRGCMLLLGNLLSQGLCSKNVDSDAFNLCTSQALMGLGNALLDSCSDSFTKANDGIEDKAAINVARTVLSLKLVRDDHVLNAFTDKLGRVISRSDSVENVGKMQGLLLLINCLVTSHRDTNVIFSRLNQNSSLLRLLKSAILSSDVLIFDVGLSLMHNFCRGNSNIIASCANDELHIFLLESFRRCGKGRSFCGKDCDSIAKACDVLCHFIQDESVRHMTNWDFAFDSVLGLLEGGCVNRGVETKGLSLLWLIMNSVSVSFLSDEARGNRIICFVHNLAIRNLDTSPESSVSESTVELPSYCQFLMDFVSRANLSFSSLRRLLNLLRATVNRFNSTEFFLVILRHLNALLGNSIPEAELHEFRRELLEFLENRIRTSLSFPDTLNEEDEALALTNLKILGAALNSKFLFDTNDSEVRKNIIAWCWQHFHPGHVFAVGNLVGRECEIFIRQYLLSLLNDESVDPSLIPTDYAACGTLLRSIGVPFESNVAVRIVSLLFDVGSPICQEFVKSIHSGLKERIDNLDYVAHEEDFTASIQLWMKGFRTASNSFSNTDLESSATESLALNLSSVKWLVFLNIKHVYIRQAPLLFVYLLTEVPCLDVRLAALENFVFKDFGNVETTEVVNDLLSILRGNQCCLEKTLEVVVNRRVGYRVMEVLVLSFHHLFSSGNPDAAFASFEEWNVLIDLTECLGSFRLQRWKSDTIQSSQRKCSIWEPHQIAGLLRICADSVSKLFETLSGFNRLVLACCDFISFVYVDSNIECDQVLVCVLRFLARVLQSNLLASIHLRKHIPVSSLANLLWLKINQVRNDGMLLYFRVIALSAVVLILLLSSVEESSCETSRVETLRTLENALFVDGSNWPALRFLLSLSPKKSTQDSLFAANNCMVLISEVLSAGSCQFPQPTLDLLLCALVLSAQSSNTIIKTSAMRCLHVVMRVSRKERTILSLELLLCKYIVSRFLRRDPVIYGAELLCLGEWIGSNFVTETLLSSDRNVLLLLLECLGNMRPTYDVDSNCTGVRQQDIDCCLSKIRVAIRLREPKTLSDPIDVKDCVLYSKGMRCALFGSYSVVVHWK